MGERFNKVKTHFQENRRWYALGATCLAIGGAVGYAIAAKHPVVSSNINQVLSYKPVATLEVYIEALGDPGNIVQDLTTGTIYASQGQAAKALGVSKTYVSQHLNGKRDHVSGHTLERLGKAMVADI